MPSNGGMQKLSVSARFHPSFSMEVKERYLVSAMQPHKVANMTDMKRSRETLVFIFIIVTHWAFVLSMGIFTATTRRFFLFLFLLDVVKSGYAILVE